MMKPEPSELVLCGCMSPPLEPGPPRRFLKKSSKNSSNGEPGGNCGIAPCPRRPPLASTVCEVEMLTTASITFLGDVGDAVGAAREAPVAAIRRLAAPRQIAANQGRRRWLKAGIAPVISGLSPENGSEFGVHSAPERGDGASIGRDISKSSAPPNTAKNRIPHAGSNRHSGVDPAAPGISDSGFCRIPRI
jgi:hypothetical protein